jgi:anaerobic selenocysteine-containing dehydrogenase
MLESPAYLYRKKSRQDAGHSQGKSRDLLHGKRVCTKGTDMVLPAPVVLSVTSLTPCRSRRPQHFGMVRMGVQPGQGAKDMLSMLYDQGALKGLIIMGEDPVSAYPFSSKIQSVLKSLDLLIVQDIALTETAKLAHIVLPAAGWAEKEGTFMNAEGVTQKLQRIIETPGQSLPDWQILRNLSLAMGKEIGTRNIEGFRGDGKHPGGPEDVFHRNVFHAAAYIGEMPSASTLCP